MNDIPDNNQFMRHCRRSRILDDGTIASSNFLLREEKGEKYLSGAWYEFFAMPDDKKTLSCAVRLMKEQGFKRVKGAFSVHTVADIQSKSNNTTTYRVCQMRESSAYSGILPTPATLHDAEAIAETVNRVLAI